MKCCITVHVSKRRNLESGWWNRSSMPLLQTVNIEIKKRQGRDLKMPGQVETSEILVKSVKFLIEKDLFSEIGNSFLLSDHRHNPKESAIRL